MISKKAAGLTEVIPEEHVAKGHASTTAKDLMPLYTCSPFYNTIVSLVTLMTTFQNHQNVPEVLTALQKIVHIKYERISYSTRAYAITCDSFMKAVRHKSTLTRLVELAEHKTFEENHKTV